MKKKIFIFQQREWANRIGVHLARKFQENNYELGCLTFKRSTHFNITNDNEIKYHIVISNDDIYETPGIFIDKDLNLEKICDELGINSIWELIYSDRNLSNSYDKNLHFNFKKKLNDKHMINVFKAIYCTCEKIYRDFKPDLILAPNFPALTHLIFYHFFKNKQIKMLGISDTKVGDYQAIYYDYNNEDGMFHYEHKKLINEKSINDEQINNIIDNFYQDNFHAYKKFNEKEFFSQLFRDFLRDVNASLKSYFNKLKRINESKLFNHQTNKIIPIIRYYIVMLFRAISEKKIKYDEIKNEEEFAYMPLQLQPEASMDIQSTKYSNQIETARQIAMNLPSNMCLYIKDHPAMYGLRKKTYLLKLKSLPNVRLINFRTPTKDILKKSKILISATGSTFFEAAIIRKPSIILGSLGDIIKLPNIEKLDEFKNLKKLIEKKIKENLNTDEYTLNLKKYIKAVLLSGFNENYVRVWQKNTSLKEDQINYIFDKLNKAIKFNTK